MEHQRLKRSVNETTHSSEVKRWRLMEEADNPERINFEDIIDKERLYMVQKIDLQTTALWDALQKDQVISSTQYAHIKGNAKNNKEEVSALLDHLKRRDEENFMIFLSCLEAYDHKHVTTHLKNNYTQLGNDGIAENPGALNILLLSECQTGRSAQHHVQNSIMKDLCSLQNVTIYETTWAPSDNLPCSLSDKVKLLGYDQGLMELYQEEGTDMVKSELVHSVSVKKLQGHTHISHIIAFLPKTSTAALYFKKVMFPDADVHLFLNSTCNECKGILNTQSLQLLNQCRRSKSIHIVGYAVKEDMKEVLRDLNNTNLYIPGCTKTVMNNALEVRTDTLKQVVLIASDQPGNTERDFDVIQQSVDNISSQTKCEDIRVKMESEPAEQDDLNSLCIVLKQRTFSFKEIFPIFNLLPVIFEGDSEVAKVVDQTCDVETYKLLFWKRDAADRENDRNNLEMVLMNWMNNEKRENEMRPLVRALLLEFYCNPKIQMTHIDFLSSVAGRRRAKYKIDFKLKEAVHHLSKDSQEITSITDLPYRKTRLKEFYSILLANKEKYDEHLSDFLQKCPAARERYFSTRTLKIMRLLQEALPNGIRVSENSLVFEIDCVSWEQYQHLSSASETMALPSVMSKCFMLSWGTEFDAVSLRNVIMETVLEAPSFLPGTSVHVRYDFDGTYENGMTGIHRAAECGALAVVKDFVEAGQDINSRCTDGRTVLMLAAEKGNESVISWVLKNGGNPALIAADSQTAIVTALIHRRFAIASLFVGEHINMCDENGEPPIVAVARRDLDEALFWILQNGADPNKKDKHGKVALHIASINGNVEAVNYLLSYNADPNMSDKFGWVSLHEAAICGHIKVVQLLLSHGANPNLVTEQGIAPLQKAMDKGHLEIARLLLSHHADPDILNPAGYTPFEMALQEKSIEKMQLLLSFNADPNLRDQYPGMPLSIAAETGNIEFAKLLLSHKADSNLHCQRVGTPLCKAARTGNIEMVQLLLSHKADPNLYTTREGTPLCKAVRTGNIEMVQLLLSHKADPNQYTTFEGTPLCTAAGTGNIEIVKLLLSHKADPNLYSQHKGTPHHTISRRGNIVMTKLLLHKADPNLYNKFEGTPLCKAAGTGNIEMVELVFTHKVDPNLFTDFEGTPLYNATGTGNIEMVKLLLSHKADPNLYTKQKGTPLHTAAREGNIDMAKILLSHKADPNLYTEFEGTPLNNATGTGNIEMVKLLLSHKADPNLYSEQKGTPLHTAVRKGNIDMAKILLFHKADPNLYTKFEGTPLYNATGTGNIEMVKLLLSHKADPNLYSEYGGRPLHTAVREGNIDMAKLLLLHKADPNVYAESTDTAQLRLLRTLGHEMMKSLSLSKSGSAPIVEAILHGHVRLLEILLSNGAKLDISYQIPGLLKAGSVLLLCSLWHSQIPPSQIFYMLVQHGVSLEKTGTSSLIRKAKHRKDIEKIGSVMLEGRYDIANDSFASALIKEYQDYQGPWTYLCEGELQRTNVFKICKHLFSEQRKVHTLAHICRQNVRALLRKASDGRSIVPLIRKLEIKESIQDDLLFKHVFPEEYWTTFKV